MNIYEIADSLKEKFLINELQIDNNSLSITIDSIPVNIEEIENSFLILIGMIGDPPLENREAFANLLLDSNFAMAYSQSCLLARNPESDSYVLIDRFSIEHIDFAGFSERLEKFADSLELYNKLLENYKPAAHQAEVQSAEQKEHIIEAMQNGFLRA